MAETIEGIVEEVIPIKNPKRPGFTRIKIQNGNRKTCVLHIATREDMSHLINSGKLMIWVGGSIPDVPDYNPKLNELYQPDEVGGIAYLYEGTGQVIGFKTFLPLKIYQQ